MKSLTILNTLGGTEWKRIRKEFNKIILNLLILSVKQSKKKNPKPLPGIITEKIKNWMNICLSSLEDCYDNDEDGYLDSELMDITQKILKYFTVTLSKKEKINVTSFFFDLGKNCAKKDILAGGMQIIQLVSSLVNNRENTDYKNLIEISELSKSVFATYRKKDNKSKKQLDKNVTLLLKKLHKN